MAKTKKAKKNRKPYNPIGPRYKTQDQFESAAQRRAKNQYRPKLQALAKEGDSQQKLHESRTGDIGKYYGAYGGDVEKSYQELQSSLNNLIASKNTSDATGQATLQAAMAKTGQADQATGSIIGGAPAAPPPVPLTMGTAAAAASNANQSETMANILKQAADQKTMVAGAQAGALNDNSRLDQKQKLDLAGRRAEILGSRGSLLQAARDELNKQEQDRQNTRFTQKLGNKEFKLKGEQFEHQKAQDAFNNSLNSRELNLKAKELQANIDNAKTEAEMIKAEKTASQFNNAVDYMSSYMAPATKKEKKNGKVNRNPAKAFSYLKRIYGLDAKTALWIINSMGDPKFKKYKPGAGGKNDPNNLGAQGAM